ncbi:uncharacterized protein BDW70DRAFT_150430 [Aspergillus foveolatus]|uniref:uncharacterized protein n=1 Tax=Aspergillus foveolatus TaxID=210207 RepID=UPI003CCD5B4B
MEIVWQDATISQCANICLQSFNDCLAQFHLLSPRQQSAVDDQLGRFSIWVSNIGVFAPTRGSLDYRLREAPDIQRLVRRLLRTLNDYIQQYLSQLDYVHPISDSTCGSPESVSDSLDPIVGGIAEEITLMHQLSNTIRKASRESQNVRAATSFKILDEDGNDIEQWFLDLFALGIIQRRFPGCNETLQKRLAVAMLIRRKRILYRRSRYWKSSTQTPSATAKAIPQPSKEDVTNQEQTLVSQKPEPEPTQRERSVASSRAVTATTLNLEHWKKASAPSVVSRAKTIHWSSHEQLDFPPPPLGPIRRRLKALRERHLAEHEERLKLLSKPLCQFITIYGRCPYEDKGCAFSHDPNTIPFHGSSSTSSIQLDSKSFLEEELERKIENDRIACNNGSMEVVCPYCCCSLSSSIVTNKFKWIDHVKYDLDPYVCLFDECESPNELYNHSEDWLNHMRQHSLRWRCTAKSHGVLVFHSRDSYEDHMSSKHKSTKSQLKILAERSSRSSGSLFESCPLCGQSTGHSLEEHVASHLRYLALKSLPFSENYEYDGCSEDLASEFQSAGGRTRSTILENDDLSELPSETGDQNELVAHGSPAYPPHPSHGPSVHLPPERASRQSHPPSIPTSGASANGMADLETAAASMTGFQNNAAAEPDNVLSKAQSSILSARPYNPSLPNPVSDTELAGSPTAGPGSSEWEFVNTAHSTHHDSSLDPILSTFQAEADSISDNNPNTVQAAPTQSQSDRRVLCHACGQIITPQEGAPPELIEVEDFNALADHAQSMSIGAAGVDPGSALEATGARNSNKTPTTTDYDLFTRAVSKYRDAFLEQHSHLAEDERLRLWTQQLPQFIDGTSNVPNLIPTLSGRKRRGSGFSEPPAERIEKEDALKFQSAPGTRFIRGDRTERTGTLSRIARESYVTNLDAETTDRANTAASPGCEHRGEILKR